MCVEDIGGGVMLDAFGYGAMTVINFPVSLYNWIICALGIIELKLVGRTAQSDRSIDGKSNK